MNRGPMCICLLEWPGGCNPRIIPGKNIGETDAYALFVELKDDARASHGELISDLGPAEP